MLQKYSSEWAIIPEKVWEEQVADRIVRAIREEEHATLPRGTSLASARDADARVNVPCIREGHVIPRGVGGKDVENAKKKMKISSSYTKGDRVERAEAWETLEKVARALLHFRPENRWSVERCLSELGE